MYALRTRAPVAAIEPKSNALPLDLHVLSLPLAFILSQDQTLHSKAFLKVIRLNKSNQTLSISLLHRVQFPVSISTIENLKIKYYYLNSLISPKTNQQSIILNCAVCC